MRQSSNNRSAPAQVLEPERELSPEEAAYRENPVMFVELARDWASGGEPPTSRHEAWLKSLPRRRIRQPEMAREALWGLLTFPERGRALAWLDKMGLIEELIPIWLGDVKLRALRLRAVEEVHREHWAKGLSKAALNRLNAFMDQKVDGRLNGWGLTSLATLVLESNGYTERYNERLNEEMRELGATEAERMSVMTAVIEYPFLHVALTKDGEYAASKFSPTTVIAALSTLFADEKITDGQRTRAVKLADELLAK
jgi:hypothetical protein